MFYSGAFKEPNSEADLSPDNDSFFCGKIVCAPFSFYARKIVITHSKIPVRTQTNFYLS